MSYPPNNTLNYYPQPTEEGRGMAIAGFVLGIIGLCAWFFPICGYPISIVGIIFSILGLKSPSLRTLAIIGIVFSGICIVLSTINAVLGVFAGLSSYFSNRIY